MTLEELIIQFLNEDYEFFKYCDKDGNKIMVKLHFYSYREFFERYMEYYREKPSIISLLEDATLGIIKVKQGENNIYYIRHPHQEVFVDNDGHERGIPKYIAFQVEQNLMFYRGVLRNCVNFSQIMDIVDKCKVTGFGELSIFDTAVRIGAFLRIAPDRVYLHAGTRVGINALEEKGYLQKGSSKQKLIKINDFPEELRVLSADEIQHFVCVKKEQLKKNLDIKKQPVKINFENIPAHTRETVRLYLKYGDVAKVAREKGVTENTIYNHLYKAGVIDPHDMISQEEYNKMKRIIENNEVSCGDDFYKLFSTPAARNAFYFIKKKK